MKRDTFLGRIAGIAVVCLVAGAAHAEEADTHSPGAAEPPAETPVETSAPAAAVQGESTTGPGDNSVNLNPIGVLFGSYALNYEYLLDGTHGFLVEGGFASDSDGDTSTMSYGAVLGYRWHWSGVQDSGFLGANVSYYFGTAEAKVNGEIYDLDMTSLTVTGNIGRRWAWDGGFNITLRFGAGWAKRDVSTDVKHPDAKKAVDNVDELVNLIPVALDGELSLGWIF